MVRVDRERDGAKENDFFRFIFDGCLKIKSDRDSQVAAPGKIEGNNGVTLTGFRTGLHTRAREPA